MTIFIPCVTPGEYARTVSTWQHRLRCLADEFRQACGHLGGVPLSTIPRRTSLCSAIVNASSYSSRSAAYSSSPFFGHVFVVCPANVVNHFVALWVWVVQSLTKLVVRPYVGCFCMSSLVILARIPAQQAIYLCGELFCSSIAGWNCLNAHF